MYSTIAAAPAHTPKNMEDRNCDARSRTSKSHHRLPKAGSLHNARLPRSNSAVGGLPRRRSFQGSKPLTPAAQAAQDGYYHRKAAKMYAEKRKAAAAATATPEDTNEADNSRNTAGLINITVDHLGVKIGDSNLGGKGGLGSRRNSRSRMSRSSSRRGNIGRSEDKENAERPTEAEIDAYFNRKRGEKDVRSIPNENASWDGSMPKRQNSKSFIERQPRPLENNNSDTAVIKGEAKPKSVEKHSEQQGEHRQRGKRRSHKKSDSSSKRVDNGEEVVAASKTCVTTTAKVSNQESKQKSEEENRIPSMSDISETEAHSNGSPPLQHDEPSSTTLPRDTESQTSGASSYKSTLSKAASSTSEASSSTDAGKWCDECAGVGLHIAALLSELKKHRPLSETGMEAPTPSSSSKKGWKSMMMGGGESKSKSSIEKHRLQNEVTVLRATVEFLYKKIEALENNTVEQ